MELPDAEKRRGDDMPHDQSECLQAWLRASAASDWRFWNKADGFAESVVFGLTSDGAGRILVKFGAVPDIAVLDGYQVSQVPSP